MKRVFLLTIIIQFVLLQNTYSQLEAYDSLLKKNVTINGLINYKSIASDTIKLSSFLTYFENTNPDESWSLNKKKAFWLNAYNAYTLKIILNNYPPKKDIDVKENNENTDGSNNVGFTVTNTTKSSITYIKKKGKNVWNIPFAKIGGKIYTLNQIEHGIIRKKFSDGRIHAALNAGSISGPSLINYSFTENNVDESLEMLMKKFVNDNSKNKITPDNIQLSKVFEWYSEDFEMGNIITFLNKYSSIKINDEAKISFLEYNWNLNENR